MFEMRNGLIWRLILISTAFGRYKIDGLRPLFNVDGLRPLYFEVDGLNRFLILSLGAGAPREK